MSRKQDRSPQIYGYIRVSSKDQNEARQIIAMLEQGISKRNLFIDKQSGKDFDRKHYNRLIKKLRRDDLMVVESIDRLGRNYEEILYQWRLITKEIGADIRVLDMPLLDTTISKDLIGTFIADLVLQVLSFVAENERSKIRKNQREGIDAALARGVHFGRQRIENPDIERALLLYCQKQISREEAIKMSGLGQSTFYERLKERKTQMIDE